MDHSGTSGILISYSYYRMQSFWSHVVFRMDCRDAAYILFRKEINKSVSEIAYLYIIV